MSSIQLPLVGLLVALAGSLSPAQEARERKSQDPVVPMALLEDALGAVRRLPLADLEATRLEELGAALIRFEGLPPFENSTRVVGPDRLQVELLGGGTVHGELIGGDGEFLDLRLIGGTRLRLSIEEFESFLLSERFPQAWTEPVVAAEEGDRLYRVRGVGVDRIDGTIESFSAEGVRMDTALGSKDFPWEEVAALFIEVLEELEPERGGASVVVDLIDGSRLALLFRHLGPDGIDLETRAGRGLHLPLTVVAEVLAAGSGIVFLSELEADVAQRTAPFGDDLGMAWPVRRDRSTSGGPLRAGGRVWTRGLGVHAPSRVEYALDGSWKSLRGWVAIDDEVIPLPARGSAQFRIKSADELLWESPVMHGGEAPFPMPNVPLSGVTRLVLEVDMADELHVGDRADWLRLILAR